MRDKNDTGHYEGALLEEVRDEMKAIRESLAPMPTLCRDVAQLKDDMKEVKAGLKTMKLVLTGHSSQINDHEGRITKLEGTPA